MNPGKAVFALLQKNNSSIEINASIEESFSKGQLLDYPQYTRPAVFKGEKVPEIIISGNHKMIAKWRQQKAEEITSRIKGERKNESKRS